MQDQGGSRKALTLNLPFVGKVLGSPRFVCKGKETIHHLAPVRKEFGG